MSAEARARTDCPSRFDLSAEDLARLADLSGREDLEEVWSEVYRYAAADPEGRRILQPFLRDEAAMEDLFRRGVEFFRLSLREIASPSFAKKIERVARMHRENGVSPVLFLGGIRRLRERFLALPEVASDPSLAGIVSRLVDCLGAMMMEAYICEVSRHLENSLWLSQRQARFLATLREINLLLFVEDLDEGELAGKVCHSLVETLGLSLAWVGWIRDSHIDLLGAFPEDHPYLAEIPRSLEEFQAYEGLRRHLERFMQGYPVLIQAVERDEAYRPRAPRLLKHGLRSLAVIPLYYGEKVSGALFLYHREPDYFLEDEVQLLQEIGRDLSVGIRHIRQRQKMEDLLYRDELTGLLSERGFVREMEERFLRSGSMGRKVAVIVTDVVDFSRLNQVLGHAGGDLILTEIARRLKEHYYQRGIVARVGADEFAVATEFEALDELKERLYALRQLMEKPFLVQGKMVRPSFGLGVAVWPDHGNTPVELLEAASSALREVSRLPDGGINFHDPRKSGLSLKRLHLLDGLERAIERRELVLYFQPKVHLDRRTVTGFEGLLRWRHPERGLVSPGEFIPVLEESRLIVEVGYLVLQQAAIFASALRAEGRGERVSVNVSVRQLHQNDFPERAAEIIERYGLTPEDLELEIVETLLLDQKAMEMVRRMVDMGFKLVLDDFGTGYSSFKHLYQLGRVDIKIDRGFLTHVPDRREQVVMLMALVSMARGLELHVVAEGVETREQLAFITGLGVDEVQGFYFARPLPPEEALAFAREFDPKRYFWSHPEEESR